MAKINTIISVDYHRVCRELATEYLLPEPFVCCHFFQTLYRHDVRIALAFFVESQLFSFVLKYGGPFQLQQLNGSEQVLFRNGTSIGSEGTLSWTEFFQLFYIRCMPDKLFRLTININEVLYKKNNRTEHIPETHNMIRN